MSSQLVPAFAVSYALMEYSANLGETGQHLTYRLPLPCLPVLPLPLLPTCMEHASAVCKCCCMTLQDLRRLTIVHVHLLQANKVIVTVT